MRWEILAHKDLPLFWQVIYSVDIEGRVVIPASLRLRVGQCKTQCILLEILNLVSLSLWMACRAYFESIDGRAHRTPRPRPVQSTREYPQSKWYLLSQYKQMNVLSMPLYALHILTRAVGCVSVQVGLSCRVCWSDMPRHRSDPYCSCIIWMPESKARCQIQLQNINSIARQV